MLPPSFVFLICKPLDGEDGLEAALFCFFDRKAARQRGRLGGILLYIYIGRKSPCIFLLENDQENDFAQTVDRPAAM